MLEDYLFLCVCVYIYKFVSSASSKGPLPRSLPLALTRMIYGEEKKANLVRITIKHHPLPCTCNKEASPSASPGLEASTPLINHSIDLYISYFY